MFESYLGTWFGIQLRELKTLPNVFYEILVKAAGEEKASSSSAIATNEAVALSTTTANSTTSSAATAVAAAYDPFIIAICGDYTQHLFYHIINTILPATTTSGSINNNSSIMELQEDNSSLPPIFVVLIGTNNIGNGNIPKQTSNGIHAIVKYILDYYSTANSSSASASSTSPSLPYIIVVELLPRGDITRHGTTWMPYIDETNHLLRQNVIPTLQLQYGYDKLSLARCGSKFILQNYTDDGIDNSSIDESTAATADGGAGTVTSNTKKRKTKANKNIKRVQYEANEILINKRLYQDLVHPNEHGHRILLQCILDHLRDVGY